MRHVVTTTSILGLAAIGLLSGCPDRTISEVNPQQGRVEYKDIPVTVNRNIDILFVIDDSGSMADKQTNLRNNFGNFINVLATIPGGLPDLHIGVVSSDFGSQTAEGAGPNLSGCSGDGKGGDLQLGQAGSAVTGKYISDIKDSVGNRTKNYTGELGTVFGQMATLGTAGCGFEQHLASMKGALNGNSANAGFVRPDAFLAVIFIADEDDCSVQKSTFFAPESAAMGPLQSFRCNRFGHTCLVGGATEAAMNQVGTKDQCGPNEASQFLTKVGDYVTFLKGLKADPSKLIVAGILGTTAPYQVELRAPPGSTTPIPSVAHSCSYQGASPTPEVADPPTRLKYFLDQFPNRSTFTTICQQDQSDGLQLIAQLLKTALGDPCIEGQLADVDPNTAGPQYDCSVSDVTNYLKPSQTETVIPPCNGGATKPCWQIETDVTNCPGPPGTTGRNFVLKIERTVTPPPDTHVIAYCVTEAE